MNIISISISIGSYWTLASKNVINQSLWQTKPPPALQKIINTHLWGKVPMVNVLKS
jgi:hypothetical protein